MRRVKIALGVGVVAVLVWLFMLGGSDVIAGWAADQQRTAQNALARGLRAVRAGEPGAWLSLMGVCAAYGFFHAAGPGHGKLMIGGYGAAVRVTARRLVALAMISSLAQAFAAVALVAVGFALLGWGRLELTTAAEDVLAPASYGAIALVGLWLMLRGLRRGWRVARHPVDDTGHCETCGHAHGPTPDQAAAVTSFRDAFGLVASVAIRPCTGAVFLLILCFGLGIPWAGVAGAIVMGLGTASVTVIVALAAVGARSSFMDGWNGSAALRITAVLEAAAGLLIAAVALGLLLPLL